MTAHAAAATATNHDGCLAAPAVGRRRRMACRCGSAAGVGETSIGPVPPCVLPYCCCLLASCCWMG